MPSNIEAYLSGALDYDALTDAERCAVRAAKEGYLVFQNPFLDFQLGYVPGNAVR